MNDQVVLLIGHVLQEPIRSQLVKKQIDVSRYAELSEEVLDDVLVIDEVFPEDELEAINERFKEYLSEYKVIPFLSIVGGNVICVGYGSSNTGQIYYFDFDFGIFELDVSIDDFLNGLQSSQ